MKEVISVIHSCPDMSGLSLKTDMVPVPLSVDAVSKHKGPSENTANGGSPPMAQPQKPPGASNMALAKLANMMKRDHGGRAECVATAKPVNPIAGVRGLLFLRNKLSKWRDSRIKTWNMNESSPDSDQSAAKNSYKLEPDQREKFLPARVRAAIEGTLIKYLAKDAKYDAGTCSPLTCFLADELKQRVKQMNYTRYKLVIHVMLGQNLGQGLQMASRCVWDLDRDNSASLTFRTTELFVIVNVFGVYFE